MGAVTFEAIWSAFVNVVWPLLVTSCGFSGRTERRLQRHQDLALGPRPKLHFKPGPSVLDAPFGVVPAPPRFRLSLKSTSFIAYTGWTPPLRAITRNNRLLHHGWRWLHDNGRLNHGWRWLHNDWRFDLGRGVSVPRLEALASAAVQVQRVRCNSPRRVLAPVGDGLGHLHHIGFRAWLENVS